MHSLRKFVILLFIFHLPFLAKSQAQDEKKTDDESPRPIFNNITFLNAANFDFSDNISGSYLGKLNLHAPDIAGTPFGVNIGIMRIKFNYKDTSNSPIYFENRLIYPLDSVKQGAKYLREVNQYISTRSNTVWSFYVQPMFRITPCSFSNKKFKMGVSDVTNGVYFHLHAELLVNKVNITTSINNIQRDTSLIDLNKNLYYTPYQKNPLIFDKTYLNGYFGVGFTFVLTPFKNGNSRLLFQPTIGKTTNYPNWTSQDITSTTVSVIPTRSGTTTLQPWVSTQGGGFYLVRAEFSQILSDNSQLTIGGDIRGLLPKYNPLYAAYIGLNISLEALLKIVSDKNDKKANAITLREKATAAEITLAQKK